MYKANPKATSASATKCQSWTSYIFAYKFTQSKFAPSIEKYSILLRTWYDMILFAQNRGPKAELQCKI